MTTPDPGGVDVSQRNAIVGAGLSALANRTEENVKAGKAAELEGDSSLSGIKTDLWSGLPDGMPLPLAILTVMGRALLDLPGQVWAAIEDLADDIGNWVVDSIDGTLALVTQIIDGVVGFADATLEQFVHLVKSTVEAVDQIGQIVAGVTVVPVITAVESFANWFTEFLGFKDNTQTSQTNLQNFQISTATAGIARNPTWVCRYPLGDVVYPEYLNARTEVFGQTDTATAGGTAHVHNLSGSTNTAYSIPAYWSITQNESRGSYITASNTLMVDTLGMILYKDTSSTMNNVFIEVFREQSTGSLIRVAAVDVSAQLTTSAKYIEATLPVRQVIQGEERYLLRVRNSSSVTGTVYAQGLVLTGGMFQSGFFTTGSTSTSKTSYTAGEAASAVAATNISPWGLIAVKLQIETEQSYSDDFNRSTMGSLWSLLSNTGSEHVGIQLGKTTYTNGLISFSVGRQAALYVKSTTRDAARVDGNIGRGLVNNIPLTDALVMGGLLLHCSRDGSQVVYLAVDAWGCKIYSGPWDSPALRVSSTTGKGEGNWSLYYDASTNTYVGLKNGAQVISWTDSGFTVFHGKDYRFGGLMHNREVIAAIFSHVSGPIDNWTLRDYTP